MTIGENSILCFMYVYNISTISSPIIIYIVRIVGKIIKIFRALKCKYIIIMDSHNVYCVSVTRTIIYPSEQTAHHAIDLTFGEMLL